MPQAPPLVSCNSQRSDMPRRQAMSIDLSGSMPNDEIAKPSTSECLSPASLHRRHHRIAEEGVRVLPRLGMPRVTRLARANHHRTLTPCLPFVAHSSTRISASTMIALSARAMTGLRSTSLIDGFAATISDNRARDRRHRVAIDRRRAAVAVEQPLRPQPSQARRERQPPRPARGRTRRRPAPRRTRRRCRASSPRRSPACAARRRSVRSRRTPSVCTSIASPGNRSPMSFRGAAQRRRHPCSPSSTPPASDLCAIADEDTFSATG